MRPTTILVTLAAIALTGVIWVASGGRAFVFILPLVALPFLMRGRR
jgi:hypothetical protein